MAQKFQTALSLLIMASFCGLVGFLIVYHYATYERPTQHFAIVVDAGSTQTRSSLFTILIDAPELARQFDAERLDEEESGGVPLSKLLQVRQVSSCVNGGPLAGLQSAPAARQLIDGCLAKFAGHIRQLDFLASRKGLGPSEQDELDNLASEREEANERMALLNHRVDSVTHLYLGATAGMRALGELNRTRALEKIRWVEEAINASRSRLEEGPFINKGYVGIIDGADEASFGWLSVNFICDKLGAGRAGADEHISLGSAEAPDGYTLSGPTAPRPRQPQEAGSVGTLELGGASAQMAYQLADGVAAAGLANGSLEEQQLELFSGRYRLATRSDLCLGMSQAVLRSNYVLLRDRFAGSGQPQAPLVELANPCLQRASRTSFGGRELGDILRGACLTPGDFPEDRLFRAHLSSRSSVTFVGTGRAQECGELLEKLIEPAKCRGYFSLCPQSKNRRPPPANMSFVTISGYNKALQSLELSKRPTPSGPMGESERLIEEKLGGHSIDYEEFTEKTANFCSMDVGEFPAKLPKMRAAFYATTCLQLIYINKLLTDFYLFNEPQVSWPQIKFLLFPVESERPQRLLAGEPANPGQTHDVRNDIGWALGLLLNATSEQLAAGDRSGWVFYHHGASVMFVMRATVFLVFACLLLAVAVLVVGFVSVGSRRRRCGSAAIAQYGASCESSLRAPV